MNKRERMEALFNQRETDYVPAGFWFHYPASYTVEQHLEIIGALEKKNIELLREALIRHIEFNYTVYTYREPQSIRYTSNNMMPH